VGQNLEHLHKAMRFFRRLYVVVVPLEWPLAALRRHRPFERRMDDPFQERLKNIAALPGTTPVDRRAAPVQFSVLRSRLDGELNKLTRFLADIDEDVAGNLWFWYGPLGFVNLLQDVQLHGLHEAHHFRFVNEWLDKMNFTSPRP